VTTRLFLSLSRSSLRLAHSTSHAASRAQNELLPSSICKSTATPDPPSFLGASPPPPPPASCISAAASGTPAAEDCGIDSGWVSAVLVPGVVCHGDCAHRFWCGTGPEYKIAILLTCCFALGHDLLLTNIASVSIFLSSQIVGNCGDTTEGGREDARAMSMQVLLVSYAFVA
jgi:hypothetical protein